MKAAVGRARGQHRAGGVRRDRDPDRHARRADRHPEGGPRRDGRPPDAVPGAVRAADPGRHGRRLARRPQAWPAAMVGGVAFAIGQFACSNYISVELTDIVASLLVGRRDRRVPARLAAGRAAARRDRRRRPARRSPARAVADAAHRGRGPPPRGRRRHATRAATIIAAYAPYVIIIVVFALAQWGPIKDFLADGDDRVRLARAWTSSTPRARRRRRSPTSSTGCPRPARCCWSRAC